MKTEQKVDSKNKSDDFVILLKTMIRMWKYVYNHKPALTVTFIIFIVLTPSIPVITRLMGSKILDELIRLIGSANKLNSTIIYLISVTIVLSVIQDIIVRIREYLDRNLNEHVSEKMEDDVISKLLYLDMEYYDMPKINDMINRVKSRYSSEPYRFLTIIFNIFEEIVRIVTNLSILFVLSPIVILIAILSTIPEVFSNAFYAKKNWKLINDYTEQRRDMGMTNNYLIDEQSIQELKTFKISRYMLDRFQVLKKDWLWKRIKISNEKDTAAGILGIVSALGHGINILILVAKALTGTITIGLFNFYWGTIGILESSIARLFRKLVEIQERGRFVSEIFDFLDLAPKLVSGNQALSNNNVPSAISFKHVDYNYPETQKKILQDFSLDITPGEHIAIVGENGAGKTTLIKLLMRFYDVSAGSITLDDIDIKDVDLASWYTKVGTLFQNYNFYHFDAKTNIGVGNIENLNDLNAIIEAAKASDAHSFIDSYTNKYEQLMSKKLSGGINPSVGQMQKIALARAFFKNAPILILDEPTSAIDPKAEFEIFERLFKFAQGKTVIIISHRFSTVRNAKRIIVLDGGKIVEEGSHNELMAIDGGKYKTAFELQRKGYE